MDKHAVEGVPNELRTVDQINFGEFVNWNIPKESSTNFLLGKMPFTFAGRTCMVEVFLKRTCGLIKSDRGFFQDEDHYNINIHHEQNEIVRGSITVRGTDTSAELTVGAFIKRTDKEEKPFFAELANKHIYPKMLDFIQQIADHQQRRLLHHVSRMPNPEYSERGRILPIKRWREIFSPVLIARGYKLIETGEYSEVDRWEKHYEPK